ncbi:hypothetical protein AHF37_08082 [Paragonimus kellicotti]|nr:hypothetical protein AHF37_08082 [Paragonimus kellicotti]
MTITCDFSGEMSILSNAIDFPSVRNSGELGCSDSRLNRVTLKIDVPHTGHSHVIGRGGRNIKTVMFETQCHVHFPDSNRTNLVEKSNQVSISGHVNNVDRARQRIRPVPITMTMDLDPAHQSVLLGQKTLEDLNKLVMQATGASLTFKTSDSLGIRERARCNFSVVESSPRKILMQHGFSSTSDGLHTASLKITGSSVDSVFLARQLITDMLPITFIFCLPLTSTSQTFLLRNTAFVRQLEDAYGVEICHRLTPPSLTRTQILLSVKGLSVNSRKVKTVVQSLLQHCYREDTNLLPVSLIFDMTMEDSMRLKNFDFARLREQYDVLVDVRAKQRQPLWSFVVRTTERNIRAVYTTWHLIKEFIALSSESTSSFHYLFCL